MDKTFKYFVISLLIIGSSLLLRRLLVPGCS
jgi:hypothetical protein